MDRPLLPKMSLGALKSWENTSTGAQTRQTSKIVTTLGIDICRNRFHLIVVFPMPTNSVAFVDFLKARMEAGEFRAVIDLKYPLEAIADAYRYEETGQKTGIVAIDVTPFYEG